MRDSLFFCIYTLSYKPFWVYTLPRIYMRFVARYTRISCFSDLLFTYYRDIRVGT